jgi:hypothetical protein
VASQTFRHKSSLPELPKGAERALIEQFRAIEVNLTDLRGPFPATTAVLARDCDVRVGELLLIAPPAGGMLVGIPPGNSSNLSKSVRIAVVGGILSPGATVSVVGSQGTINGAATLSLTTLGITEITSTGDGNWSSQPVSSGGGITDGVYGSITVSGGGTIFRITDGVYGGVTVSGGGLIWTVAPGATPTWAQVLTAGAVSGASNPIVNVGQFLQLGLVGPTSLGAQIRSGDATLVIQAGTDFATFSGASTSAIATISMAYTAAGGPVSFTAATFVRVITNGVERLEITSTGEWQVNNVVGALGNVLTSQGAGTPPIWAAPAAGGSLALLTTEVNLGTRPTWSGSFTIVGAGMTIGKPVLIQQAAGPYTGKGTLADEAEEQVTASASVTSAVLITAYWKATGSGPVAGNFKFNYAVSA